jgi:hypothetical protein
MVIKFVIINIVNIFSTFSICGTMQCWFKMQHIIARVTKADQVGSLDFGSLFRQAVKLKPLNV